MLKAVVTDLDGTLLNKDHRISKFTIETMRKLIDSGYKLYIATGRIERGAKLISDEIDRRIPLITTNGARIVDEENNELLSVYLKDEVVKILTNLDYESFGEDLFINGYSGKDWYIVNDKHLKMYFKKRLDKTYRPDLITPEEFKTKKFNKIYFVGKFEDLKKIREYLRPLISDKANIDFVSKQSLEIYDLSTNKYNAAKQILKRDNIKEDEVICFGDGLNDYEMLSGFSNSYVMDNGLDELKELLPNKEILEDSDTNSVAKKIIKEFNL